LVVTLSQPEMFTTANLCLSHNANMGGTLFGFHVTPRTSGVGREGFSVLAIGVRVTTASRIFFGCFTRGLIKLGE